MTAIWLCDPEFASFAPATLMGLPQAGMTIVGTTVFPTLSDTLDLGYGAGVTPAGLHYLVPEPGAVPPPDTAFVRFRPGVTPGAGRQELTARLAGPGHFLVEGPATPTDCSTSARCRTCRRYWAPRWAQWPC